MRKLSFEEITRLRPTPDALKRMPRLPVITVLDNIRSLYNVGSIFRTADGVRMEALYLTGITGYPPRKEIEKTALGATETVPWKYWKDARQAVQQLKQSGYTILALEHTTESVPYSEVQYRFPLALILGNEVFGVQDELLPLVDAAIEIPMLGAKQSLNVSVAFGVVAYHLLNVYFSINPAFAVAENEGTNIGL
ncbi:MAG: RNA methyltransferase [Calditrichaeota bacterium]|nr:RNA methyltransferase [Calditrichota bacterium]